MVFVISGVYDRKLKQSDCVNISCAFNDVGADCKSNCFIGVCVSLSNAHLSGFGLCCSLEAAITKLYNILLGPRAPGSLSRGSAFLHGAFSPSRPLCLHRYWWNVRELSCASRSALDCQSLSGRSLQGAKLREALHKYLIAWTCRFALHRFIASALFLIARVGLRSRIV